MHFLEHKIAFIELCKYHLKFTHGDDLHVACLDMVVNFPISIILEYLEQSQMQPQTQSLRHLAHATIHEFYGASYHFSPPPSDVRSQVAHHISTWKKQHLEGFND